MLVFNTNPEHEYMTMYHSHLVFRNFAGVWRRNVSHSLTCWNSPCTAGGTAWEGYGSFRGWSLAGGSKLSSNFSLIPEKQWGRPVSCSPYSAVSAMTDYALQTVSQKKPFLLKAASYWVLYHSKEKTIYTNFYAIRLHSSYDWRQTQVVYKHRTEVWADRFSCST